MRQSSGQAMVNHSIDTYSIGDSCPQHFLHQHPELETVLSTTTEAARIKGVSNERSVKWYAVVEEVIVEHQILEENI